MTDDEKIAAFLAEKGARVLPTYKARGLNFNASRERDAANLSLMSLKAQARRKAKKKSI